MTDVERLVRPTTPRPSWGLRHSRRVLPALVVVAVCSSTVTILSRPASASIQSDRQRAAQILSREQTVARKVAYLGQLFDRARLRLANEQAQIARTQQLVASAGRHVSVDRRQMRNAALSYYVNSGAQAAQNPLFTSTTANAGAANIYAQIAEGNLSTTVSSSPKSSGG